MRLIQEERQTQEEKIMSKDRMKRRERQTIEDIITPRKEKLRNSVEWR
jgi:hypothetical protein